MSDALRKAAEQALEAFALAQTDIEWQLNSPTRKVLRKAEIALRAALSEPEFSDSTPVDTDHVYAALVTVFGNPLAEDPVLMRRIADAINNTAPPQQVTAEPDVADIIAGALQISRGDAYTLMQRALLCVEPVTAEPVAWMQKIDLQMRIGDRPGVYWRPLYASPPPAPAVPLSESQIWEIGQTTLGQQGGWNVAFARAIERAHGIGEKT